jgi:hypothetical protein
MDQFRATMVPPVSRTIPFGWPVVPEVSIGQKGVTENVKLAIRGETYCLGRVFHI